jgi:hypothetical protein
MWEKPQQHQQTLIFNLHTQARASDSTPLHLRHAAMVERHPTVARRSTDEDSTTGLSKSSTEALSHPLALARAQSEMHVNAVCKHHPFCFIFFLFFA